MEGTMEAAIIKMSEIVPTTENSTESNRTGCKHYARKCQFISPCCKKYYTCRVCHDESESHEIDRSAVNLIKCLQCKLVQQVHKACKGCGVQFGKYYCEKCRLFDDEDKGQFHCDACGLCRVGGKSHFFHCEKCDMCLSVKLKNSHKCVEESSRRNCAVCLEDLHTSRKDAHIPPCGHLIHRVCMDQCMKTGNYACPTCTQSMVDMKNFWKVLDEEVANTPMPEEYRDHHVFILCRDCHKESRVLFHVIGMKCQECGSYNTCQTTNHEESSEVQAQSTPNGNPEPVGEGAPTSVQQAATGTESSSSPPDSQGAGDAAQQNGEGRPDINSKT